MNELTSPDDYGSLSEPATLTIQRLLPGPIERIWSYLTDSELRRQWLASGDMQLTVGASFDLVWRNDELTTPTGQRPAEFPDEHRLQSQITELDPPHKLSISWGSTGGVSFVLEQKKDKVMLTVIHRRLPDRSVMLNVSAGWHMHLDVLRAKLNNQATEPFWEGWSRLKAEYEQRLPQ